MDIGTKKEAYDSCRPVSEIREWAKKKGLDNLGIKKADKRRKMTTSQVVKAREMYYDGKISQADLAKKYKVSSSVMSRIIQGDYVYKN